MASIRGRAALVAMAFALMASGLAACTQPSPVSKTAEASKKAATVRGISDLPMPNGADPQVDESLVLGNLDAWTGRLVLTSSLSAEESFDFYRDRMGAFDWTPISSVQSETSVLTFERGDRIAIVQIEARTLWGSRVSITMAPRQSESGASRPSNQNLEVTPIQ